MAMDSEVGQMLWGNWPMHVLLGETSQKFK